MNANDKVIRYGCTFCGARPLASCKSARGVLYRGRYHPRPYLPYVAPGAAQDA